MNYNKDLYQILKISKNASQQEINNLTLTKSSRDDSEVNKALMVLCEPAKRIEYDTKGWQSKWDDEFDEWIAACHDTFEAIHSHIGYGQQAIYHPDGRQIWIGGWELDPSLWVPFNSKSADANWIEKIYSIKGENWRGRMEEYKSKMLAAIDQIREEKKKTPFCEANWEYVASGNCAKCGQKAKIRDARGEDNRVYCSQKCFFDNWESRYKVPKYEYKVPSSDFDFKCVRCYQKGKDVYEMEDGRYYHKSCFAKELEKHKEPYDKDRKDEYPAPNKDRTPEPILSDKIKQLEKEIEHYKSKKLDKIITEKEKIEVQKIIDDLEKQLKYERAKNFFSKKGGGEKSVWKVEKTHNRITGETTTTKQKYNPLQELLNWMKKEGIINISLNPNDNLVVEYSGGQAQVVNDNNLTDEQKEIKEFFTTVKGQGGETHFNQRELEKAINQETNQENKDKNNNGWVAPVIIGMGVLILVLIGVIIYKNKKKGYLN